MGKAAREVSTSTPPQIGTDQIRLLEQLCNACAVSGDESEVRQIVIRQIRDFADDLQTDALGNVLGIKKGKQPVQLRVMLAAHMDEVGLMITQDDGEGIFRFETVGGVNPSRLPGKTVWIGHNHVPGIIGVKPIHLLEGDELNAPISKRELRIDVSPDCADQVKVGDRAAFAPSFAVLGKSIRSKALDDRFGVATLIELFQHAPPQIDFLAAFTVQEEIGLSGAKVAAYTFDPDLAIVLDCTPANDFPDFVNGQFQPSSSENSHYNTRLGKGPAIYIADACTISDPRLVRHFMQTGDELGIPYQLRQPGGGGTDACAIHVQREGIPSISISVPGRYAHTGAMLARLSDWENTLALVYNGIKRLSADILASERQLNPVRRI